MTGGQFLPKSQNEVTRQWHVNRLQAVSLRPFETELREKKDSKCLWLSLPQSRFTGRRGVKGKNSHVDRQK